MIARFNGQYQFLSNFYASPINFEGMDYPTVEHAYQAAKTEDPYLRASIAALSDPGKAKASGRGLVLRADWDAIKETIMHVLLIKKFRDPELALKLVNTGGQELIEGNYWHDNYWGKCLCANCHGGQNKLGTLLMMVRTQIVRGELHAIVPDYDGPTTGSPMEKSGEQQRDGRQGQSHDEGVPATGNANPNPAGNVSV
jgi:ribA/ribD-fused uncharacterized protein